MSVLAVARCRAALVDILADSELGLLEDAAVRYVSNTCTIGYVGLELY
jgi:hypothetical protein